MVLSQAKAPKAIKDLHANVEAERKKAAKALKDIQDNLASEKEKATKAIKELNEKRAEFRKEVRSEFRKQALTAITAALALVIALAWRDPIEVMVKGMVAKLGFVPDSLMQKFISAAIITVVAAIALVFLARWARAHEPKPEEKKP